MTKKNSMQQAKAKANKCMHLNVRKQAQQGNVKRAKPFYQGSRR